MKKTVPVPPTETCANQADDDGDGVVDEEDWLYLQPKHVLIKQTTMVMEL